MTDMKKCPYCGEEVKLEAIKCKHCRSMLSEEDNALVGAATPKSKKPIWKRWWVWASAALLLLIIISAAAGNGNDTSQATTPIEQEENATVTVPEPEPSITLISVGETTTFAEWEYKVIDVQYHNTLRDERARGTYAVFMLEATNNSNVPRDIGWMFQVEDDQGRVFAFDSSASLAHHHTFRDDTWHLEDIGASFTGTMPIAFDIPEDAETLFFYPREIREEDLKDTSVIMVER